MTTFTARSTEDVLALVPVLIGFEPRESVVMLTFGGRESFHARIDLPPPSGVASCAAALLAPVQRYAVRGVVLVIYSDQDPSVRRVASVLERRFRAVGVHVLQLVHVRDGRWFAPLGRAGVPADGVPYDVTHHPYRLQAVVEGRVVAGSRAELADRLRGDPEEVEAVEEELGALWEGLPLEVRATLRATSSPDEACALLARVRPGGPALRAMLDRHLEADTVPDDEEAARILLAVHNAEIRDHAWVGIRRAEASAHVRLWSDLVRRSPEGLVAGAAGVLAFAAWMHGDGALAWCAVERCLEDDPDHSLGRLMAGALEQAVPPKDDWSRGFSRGIAG